MDVPLAVLFTSFSNRTDKLFVYTNTIRNWAAFLPHIQPVLFTTFETGPVIDIAKEYGWYILPNPAVNEFGIPILKDMYLAAYKRFNTTFYGYANGDILFDVGLDETLCTVSEHISSINTTLLFGVRRNYELLPEADYSNDPLWPPSRIAQLVQKNQTKMFRARGAYDYFFVTKDYPFHKFKPVVISRPGFDTYFAAITNIQDLTTVTGTGSIMALHQTDHDGNMAHRVIQRQPDREYNYGILLKLRYYLQLQNAKYGSIWSENGRVILKCHQCKNMKDLL